VITRAIAKVRAHETLAGTLRDKIDDAPELPGQFQGLLSAQVERAFAFAEEVAGDPAQEDKGRLATNALYHAASAVLLAWEGATVGAAGGDARRLLLSRMVVDHRLLPQDPLASGENRFDKAAAVLLLQDDPVPLARVTDTLAL